MKNNSVLLSIFIFNVLFYFTPLNGDFDKTNISIFESHLQESPYSIALTLCMQIWSESRMQQEAQSKDDFFLIQDLIVGRLIRLQQYIIALKSAAAETIILSSDLSYLLTILSAMEEEQRKIDEKSIFFKDHLVLKLLRAIQQQIIEFL